MSEYWQDRISKAQDRLTKKNQKEINKQLVEYYQKASFRVVNAFVNTYNRVMDSAIQCIEITPADLYKLNTYWEMQAELKDALQKLGDKQIDLLNKSFTKEYMQIYQSLNISDSGAFSNIDEKAAQQIINQIWAADGESWSKRVWKNTDKLQQALNDNLLQCVITGQKSDYLKQKLVEQFNVSYNRADTLVKTELAHIQTQAARQRYEDAGIKEVQVWADKDERRCEICGGLHKKKFSIYANIPIPAHPRCRCAIVPVIE